MHFTKYFMIMPLIFTVVAKVNGLLKFVLNFGIIGTWH